MTFTTYSYNWNKKRLPLHAIYTGDRYSLGRTYPIIYIYIQSHIVTYSQKWNIASLHWICSNLNPVSLSSYRGLMGYGHSTTTRILQIVGMLTPAFLRGLPSSFKENSTYFDHGVFESKSHILGGFNLLWYAMEKNNNIFRIIQVTKWSNVQTQQFKPPLLLQWPPSQRRRALCLVAEASFTLCLQK
jgi:hypothetical protein